MRVRALALASAVVTAAGCAPSQPLSQPAPIVGHSPQSASEALGVAAQSLATQGFRIERHVERGEVVGGKVARLNDVGPELRCNMPPNTNPWVVLSVTVQASSRGDASTLRIDGRARIDAPDHSQPLGANYGCVSTGLAESRLATALGLPLSSN